MQKEYIFLRSLGGEGYFLANFPFIPVLSHTFGGNALLGRVLSFCNSGTFKREQKVKIWTVSLKAERSELIKHIQGNSFPCSALKVRLGLKANCKPELCLG